jgi:hypothetical protein
MPVALPKDLVSAAQLAAEWGCTRRNANASLRRWGVKRYEGNRVSRAQAEEKKSLLSSPTQAENSAKAWKRSAPEAEQSAAGGKSKADAERIRAWIRAERDRLELEERKRTLINAAEVEQATFERGRMERDALLNWPAQIVPDLAAKLGVEERALHSELDDLVRKFLEQRSRI